LNLYFYLIFFYKHSFKVDNSKNSINKLIFNFIFFSDMSQFGLSTSNTHWGYSSASPYSPYLTGNTLSSCATPTAAQFNNPALGFTCSSGDQNVGVQDFGSTGSRDCVPSKFYQKTVFFFLKFH
jgi:hypothetical protein